MLALNLPPSLMMGGDSILEATMSIVPNVVITNPKARKIARTVLDSVGAALVITMAVDAATPAFDLLAVTTPTLAGWGAARTVFGFTVDNPNTPVEGA